MAEAKRRIYCIILNVLQIVIIVSSSEKKGVAHWWELYNCDDFKVLNNMHWWYEYHQSLQFLHDKNVCTSTIDNYKQSFIPMIWGRTNSISIGDEARYILTQNEPNHQKQANMTAAEVVASWGYIEKNSKGKPIIGPSAAPCGSDCLGNVSEWFDEFFELCNGSCRVDFLATHTYWCNAKKVMDRLRVLYNRYQKKIWLTEFACGDYSENQTQMIEFMKDILPQLEAAEYVAGYAWYAARLNETKWVTSAASLLDPAGSATLTPLGIFYNGFEGTEKVDGVWNGWGEWSECSVSCGEGVRSRKRTCFYPNPSVTELPCTGGDTEAQQCAIACPGADTDWENWSQWSQCSEPCSIGTRRRTRSCLSQNVNECAGPAEESKQCGGFNCIIIVDGVWASLSPWSECSVSCGTGNKARERKCWFPSNVRNGKDCVGSKLEATSCILRNC